MTFPCDFLAPGTMPATRHFTYDDLFKLKHIPAQTESFVRQVSINRRSSGSITSVSQTALIFLSFPRCGTKMIGMVIASVYENASCLLE